MNIATGLYIYICIRASFVEYIIATLYINIAGITVCSLERTANSYSRRTAGLLCCKIHITAKH